MSQHDCNVSVTTHIKECMKNIKKKSRINISKL